MSDPLTFPENTDVGPNAHLESEHDHVDPDQTLVKVPHTSESLPTGCTVLDNEDVSPNLPSGSVSEPGGKSCSSTIYLHVCRLIVVCSIIDKS